MRRGRTSVSPSTASPLGGRVRLGRRVEQRTETTRRRRDAWSRGCRRRSTSSSLPTGASCTPQPTASAVAAVHRGEPRTVSASRSPAATGPVVGPAEARGGRGGAVDAGELPDPQVQVDGERAAPDACAHVARASRDTRVRNLRRGCAASPRRSRSTPRPAGSTWSARSSMSIASRRARGDRLDERRCGGHGCEQVGVGRGRPVDVSTIREQGSPTRASARIGRFGIVSLRRQRGDVGGEGVVDRARARRPRRARRDGGTTPFAARTDGSRATTLSSGNGIAEHGLGEGEHARRGRPSSPRVAEVATGVTSPSGPVPVRCGDRVAGRRRSSVRPSRRSSIATSVPWAPS